MPLLLIEDDLNMILSLKLALNSAGFKVDSASDGLTGLDMACNNNYRLILLDCNLPKLSGPEIVKKLRALKYNTPIIILTVLSELNDKLELFGLGADDYLIKPFSVAELLARINALLRRPPNLRGQILKVGNLELDPDKFCVTKNGAHIPMCSREFALLEYLMLNQGKFLSKQDILDNVWDENANLFSNTVEVHIMNLRKKIDGPGEYHISTASNRGYKLDK